MTTPKSRPAKSGYQDLDDHFLRSWPIPDPEDGADKNARGIALLIAGTDGMPGAAILAATAAFRAGAGKVQVAAPECVAPWIAVSVPETLVIRLPEKKPGHLKAAGIDALKSRLPKARAVLIGPGMSGGEALTKFVTKVVPALKNETVLILDAEAIACAGGKIEQVNKFCGDKIITPHLGEMAKLLDRPADEIARDPLHHAREFAARTGVITVMKGATTYIVEPSGKAYRNAAGNVGLATSGSGDTLAGLIAGIAARGASGIQAACWGVALHARAGERLAKKVGPLGFLARELAAEIPALL